MSDDVEAKWEQRRWDLAMAAGEKDIEAFRAPYPDPRGGMAVLHHFTPEQARFRYADAIIAAARARES